MASTKRKADPWHVVGSTRASKRLMWVMKKTRSDKAKKPKEKHVSLVERMDDACYALVKPAPDKETGRRYARSSSPLCFSK